MVRNGFLEISFILLLLLLFYFFCSGLLHIAVKLGFDCINNMKEYEACIVGLQAALEFVAHELEVFGDSLLIVAN